MKDLHDLHAPQPAPRGFRRRGLMAMAASGAASALLGATGPLLPRSALAQADFPNHPIRIVVPFAAGGGVDIVARLMAEPMREQLGQPVVVENRGGAGGQIGAQAVARAPADGYTILLASAGEIAVAPQLYGNRLPYDPAKELAPVTLAVRVPNLLVVGANVPARNAAELIELARRQPGELSYATAGVGNLQHLNGELFDRLAKVETVHIPYRGTGPALADVAAGRVTMTYAGAPAMLPLIREGKLRPIGLTSRTRMESLGDIPALAETPALAEYELVNWYGLFAPAGTPAPALQRLHAAAAAALRDPEVVRKLAEQGAEAAPMDPAEFGAFVAAETEKLGRIVREADIRPEG